MLVAVLGVHSLYMCASLSDLVPIPEERARSFQFIHPICVDCKENGKTERTRGKRLAGQKRKAPSASHYL